MKSGAVALLILGLIVALAGLTFTLQGLGYVGPPASFMFRNPTWIAQGEFTFAIGAILVLAAAALNRQASSPNG